MTDVAIAVHIDTYICVCNMHTQDTRHRFLLIGRKIHLYSITNLGELCQKLNYAVIEKRVHNKPRIIIQQIGSDEGQKIIMPQIHIHSQ